MRTDIKSKHTGFLGSASLVCFRSDLSVHAGPLGADYKALVLSFYILVLKSPRGLTEVAKSSSDLQLLVNLNLSSLRSMRLRISLLENTDVAWLNTFDLDLSHFALYFRYDIY